MTFDDIHQYEKLTGRKLPVPIVAGEEVPAPSQEQMQLYWDMQKMVKDSAFANVLRFFRTRAFSVLDGKKADTASDFQLRHAKACYEVTAELGPILMQEIQSMEELISLRENYMKEKEEREGAPPPDEKTNF